MDPATSRRMRTAHANHTHTCYCGRIVRGNGGWASHRWACPVFQARAEEFAAEQNFLPYMLVNVRRAPDWEWNGKRWISVAPR